MFASGMANYGGSTWRGFLQSRFICTLVASGLIFFPQSETLVTGKNSQFLVDNL